MDTKQSAENNDILIQPRRLIQSLVALAIGVFVVQISRSAIKVVSSWAHVDNAHRAWLYLIPLAVVLLANCFVVLRIKDRLLQSMYMATVVLLLFTHLVTLSGLIPRFPQLLMTILDVASLTLLAAVVFRNGYLLHDSSRQRHEYVLESLAFGTSHQIGQDFLAAMVDSIVRILRIDVVFVSERRTDAITESVVAVAKREDAELLGPLNIGAVVDYSLDFQATLLAGGTALIMPLRGVHGTTIGHLVLLHKSLVLTRGQECSLQVFASRASAEIQRLQSDRRKEELESQILRAQKMESLGVLAGGIAHDFNNVLQAIRGYSALTSDISVSEEVRNEAVSHTDAAVDKGAMMCSRLLAYAGKSVRKNTVCIINRIVRETVEIVQAAKQDWRFTLQLGNEPIRVWGDPSQLSQVIMNLLTNAIDSMNGRNGEVVVTTEGCQGSALLAKGMKSASDANYAVIRVSDKGCGIPTEASSRIFDPYYTSKGDGRGIGLASVAGIVRSHQGDISFTSELDVGTTFLVALPITNAREQSAPVEAERQMPLEDASVLLVDDDEPVRVAIGMMLKNAGVTITMAASGKEAMSIIEDTKRAFSVVLIDQTMPGISGLETIHQLRSRGFMCPMVLMSGYTDVAIDEDLHKVRFLAKPCRREELLNAVAIASGADVAESARRRRVG